MNESRHDVPPLTSEYLHPELGLCIVAGIEPDGSFWLRRQRTGEHFHVKPESKPEPKTEAK